MRPRIFFLTGWTHVPDEFTAGGPKILLQRVKILREAGIEAWIVARPPTGLARVFGREPASEYLMSRRTFEKTVTARDLVNAPAVRPHELRESPGRKVLTVLNGALLFRKLPADNPPKYPWHDVQLEAIMCMSDHDTRLVELADPGCPVIRVFDSVDAERFRPAAWPDRENLVLVSTPLPYKNPWHAFTVAHLVRSRAISAGHTPPRMRVIEGIRPDEMPELMRRAKALIFLSVADGFGLLPLEAMLSGTPVLTYRNQPMDEFVPPELRHDISDFAGLVKTLESILDPAAADHWTAVMERSRETCLSFSRERQRRSVLEAWVPLVEGG